jgi:hypothetical protein
VNITAVTFGIFNGYLVKTDGIVYADSTKPIAKEVVQACHRDATQPMLPSEIVNRRSIRGAVS